MNDISIVDFFPISKEAYDKYNVHLASNALKAFLFDRESWLKNWNSNQGHGDKKRIAFKRDFIVSFVQLYTDEWLFGGVIRRLDENGRENPVFVEKFNPLIGRLIVKCRKGRTNYRKMENIWSEITVKEILDIPMETLPFNGYENVHLSFDELKLIINQNVRLWREKLESIQGIYLIFDKKSQQMYIGKADGNEGIWQRWGCYVRSDGTGYNDRLTKLIRDNGADYAQNFEFSILEYYFKGEKSKKFFDQRESHWKNIFHSRLTGLNGN